MTLEDKLRNALRETAGEIPDEPPPLRLSPLAVSRHQARQRSAKQSWAQRHRARWPAWAAPLAAAAAIVALVTALLTLAHDRPNVEGPSNGQGTTTPSGPAAVPPYYVALMSPGDADVYNGDATAAEVRATLTGAVLARVVPPKPYVHFTGVTAAADDRTFVLVAEEKSNPPTGRPKPGQLPHPYYQPSRFYLLRFDPGAGRASLRALPAAFIPANAEVHDVALSPDGTALAADIDGQGAAGDHLVVFDLTTGAERAWSFQTCPHCLPSGGGLGYGGISPDALSWTADGKHLAFVGPGRSLRGSSAVRLLDVTLPGSDLVANSRPVAGLPPGDQLSDLSWRGAIITPDGQNVVIVEELANDRAPVKVRDRLLKVSVATGRVTVLNDLNVLAGYQYEQVMYSDASGSVLVVSGARKGSAAGILRGRAYTPIPWDRAIATAIW
jgi:hypothetical protein